MAYTISASPRGVHFNSTTAAALRRLLNGAIDYAGLFPPAQLELGPAVKNYARYLRSEDAWMLSTFVLPIGQFGQVQPYLSDFDGSYPLRVSALGQKTNNATGFDQAWQGITAAVRETGAARMDLFSVVQLELALPPDPDAEMIGALDRVSGELELPVFCEAPAADAVRTIALLAQNNTTKHAPLGFKLRTGGIAADAFPTSDEIACVLVAATRDAVPIKFTAGLHHPVRQFRDEAGGKMHGFLNVFGAGVLCAEHGWDENLTAQMLEDEDPAAFSFDADVFRWRDWAITADAINGRRRLVTSFGSCSFDEPRDDLRALRLL
jgi:hypothetical protein